MSRGTVGVCAVQAGVLERALELTAEYARSREQFGRPIGSFQAVAQRLADAYIDVEAVRLTMWQAAWLLAAGSRSGPEVAAAVASAKFWAADAGHRVAHTAVHVHGGMGIDTSYPVHRYFVAAKRASSRSAAPPRNSSGSATSSPGKCSHRGEGFRRSKGQWMSRVVVIGATGHIGTYLVPRLVDAGP